MAIRGEHLPTEVRYDNCSQVKTLVRTMSTQMSFPESVSDSLCRNASVVQTQFHQLSGWQVSNNLTGEEARCGGSGLAWLRVVCGYEAG